MRRLRVIGRPAMPVHSKSASTTRRRDRPHDRADRVQRVRSARYRSPDRPPARVVRGRTAPPVAVAAVLLVLVVFAAGYTGVAVVGEEERPVVVTSTTVFADLVGQVGGDLVVVRSLVGVRRDPHVFEPRPSDAVAVAEAELVVDGGLGLSPWLASCWAPGRAGAGPGRGGAGGGAGEDGLLDPHVCGWCLCWWPTTTSRP